MNYLSTTTKLFFLLCLIALFLTSSCKDDDEMDLLAHEEHKFLSCKINGEDWKSEEGKFFSTFSFDLQYYSDTGGFELVASNSGTNTALYGAIHLVATNVRTGNISPLIDNESSLYHLSNSNNLSECKYYFDHDTNVDNYILISEIDSLEFYMVGEFAFSAINECQDTIRVTEGSFDLKYRF